MKIIRMLLQLLIVGSFLSACAPGPSNDVFETYLQNKLQGDWSIESFSIKASENKGTDTKPRYLVRFKADVSPTHDLYRKGRIIDGVRIVSKVMSTNDTISLYGLMGANLRHEQWIPWVKSVENKNELNVGIRLKYVGQDFIIDTNNDKKNLTEIAKIVKVREEKHQKEWGGTVDKIRELLSTKPKFTADIRDDRNTEYKTKIKVTQFNKATGELVGELHWFTDKPSIHVIKGRLYRHHIEFEEVERIKEGDAVLGCKYKLQPMSKTTSNKFIGNYSCYRDKGFIEMYLPN